MFNAPVYFTYTASKAHSCETCGVVSQPEWCGIDGVWLCGDCQEEIDYWECDA